MAWPTPAWLDALPPGPAYAVNHPLAPETTIQVGGPAQVWAPCGTWAQVAALRAFATAHSIPFTLLGKGSNMVVADGGIGGLVVPLGKGCDAVRVEGTTLYAEAGAATGTAARAAREAGLAGLAFFGGIPGSVGGALRMNAGAYGHETFDAVTEVVLLDAQGQTVVKPPSFVQPRYRGTTLPEGWLYQAARWHLQPGDKEQIRQQMREINQARSTSQPLHLPSSGSWFKNVPVTAENLAMLERIHPGVAVGGVVNAWRVVAAAGCRGLREGGAQVSEQHCNFFVNLGLKEGQSATAAEFDRLSARVEAAVLAKFGLVLQREVRFVGEGAA
ncbi:MAG: UDP-N-acetylmuramate dehydrogenase [Alphaproteobacteria bacterium]|nr:UDP-N-acetylmuramate dehydrogenase [Alphaproteobacteria bacterium]